MVGIVVVSHSRALARAAVALASQMVHGQPLRIAVAAGLDEDTLGTDAIAISEALATADDGDGVVVLMDLGSAVLSTELAVDLLADDAARARVILCPGPLVEGLVVAAVAAAGGATSAEVAAEASSALAGKASQLEATARPLGTTAPETDPAAVTGTFTVANPHGLHARPAARLVREVRATGADVRVRNLTTGTGPVTASSLSRVATLGALAGHEVEVSATGPRAREAVDRVCALAGRAFDEVLGSPDGTNPNGNAHSQPHDADADADDHHDATTGPFPASPGVGVGPAWLLRTTPLVVPDEPPGDPDQQWRRLRRALDVARGAVREVQVRTAGEAGGPEAGIFEAHLLLLEDDDLLGEARRRLAAQGAAPAWAAAVNAAEQEFAALADPYLRARAADVRAVGDQVLRVLLSDATPAESSTSAAQTSATQTSATQTSATQTSAAQTSAAQQPAGTVLVAPDLTPAQAAGLDPARVAAVVLAFGSPTAHSAILARSRGIPTIVAAGSSVLDLPPGTVLAVDGDLGELVVRPRPEVRADYADRARRRTTRDRTALARAHAPALTQDGTQVLVAANVGSAEDARAAAAAGADGAGLVRTEFLFLHRAAAPDVEEQEQAYLAIAEAFGGRRITLRTLDVGGDKPLGYLPMRPEANPFLGMRGLRLSLTRPQLLRDQLTAMVRVARRTPVSLMFPMVSTVAELVRARQLLDRAIAGEGCGRPTGLQVGIMVEVPAAALKARAFAPYLDFFSVGTNDLTQYALAAERGNDATAALGDPFDPGVLRLIEAACSGAAPGTLVAVCGEFAADERAVGLLLGMGVRELSVTPTAVAAVKQAVRTVDLAAARDLGERATAAEGPDAVRALLCQIP